MSGDFVDIGPVPSWMVVDAVRYCLGRSTSQVFDTTRWLLEHWSFLPDRLRMTIRKDVEEAFSRDDRAREVGIRQDGLPLGWDSDRRNWESVRNLWRGQGT
jgi:hypothetical protein